MNKRYVITSICIVLFLFFSLVSGIAVTVADDTTTTTTPSAPSAENAAIEWEVFAVIGLMVIGLALFLTRNGRSLDTRTFFIVIVAIIAIVVSLQAFGFEWTVGFGFCALVTLWAKNRIPREDDMAFTQKLANLTADYYADTMELDCSSGNLISRMLPALNIIVISFLDEDLTVTWRVKPPFLMDQSADTLEEVCGRITERPELYLTDVPPRMLRALRTTDHEHRQESVNENDEVAGDEEFTVRDDDRGAGYAAS